MKTANLDAPSRATVTSTVGGLSDRAAEPTTAIGTRRMAQTVTIDLVLTVQKPDLGERAMGHGP